MVTSFPNRKYKKEIDDITNLFRTGIERENIKKDARYDTLKSEHRSLFDDLNNMFSSGTKDDKVHVCNVCQYEIKDKSVSLFDTAPVCARCANEGFLTNLGRSTDSYYSSDLQKPTYDDDTGETNYNKDMAVSDDMSPSQQHRFIKSQMKMRELFDIGYVNYKSAKKIADLTDLVFKNLSEDDHEGRKTYQAMQDKNIATLRSQCSVCGPDEREQFLSLSGLDLMDTDLCQACKEDGYL